MRHRRAGWVLLTALTALLPSAASVRAGSEVRLPNSALRLTDDPSDPNRAVAGIVCDNPPGLDELRRDRLEVRSDYFAGASGVSVSLLNDRGMEQDATGHPN